jgi:ribokinase
MSIAIVGSINVDVTAYAPTLARPGETVLGDKYLLGLGGKGANQAVAAAKLGSSVSFIGRVGEDRFGDKAIEELERYGVDTSLIRRDPGQATGIAVIAVDARGENAITVIPGANMALEQSDIERGREALSSASVVMLQLETPPFTSLAASAVARAARARIIFDPAPAPYGGLDQEVWREIDILTPNEIETEVILGFHPSNPEEARQACHALRKKGVKTAIVKLGANGVYFAGADEEGFVPPFIVHSIDTVGAGDCFNGGLAHALDRGMAMAEAVRFAAACGALSTTRYGAAAAAPSREEVLALLARG